MSYVLFISEAKLKDSTAINLNVDVDLLLPLCTAITEAVCGN